MIDVNACAQLSLEKTGANVVYLYPQSKEKLPVIGFYTLMEQGSFSADNSVCFRDATVAVEIFAASPKECGELAKRVDCCMGADDWMREFSRDIPDDTDGIFHKSMRFTRTFYLEEE